MSEVINIDVQAKIIPALIDLGARDRTATAVRTAKLAKRIRRLGIRIPTERIAEQLENVAKTPWGRQHAVFVGGSPDPMNQYEWALPATQE